MPWSRTITMPLRRDPCVVVDQFCLAPANLSPLESPKTECFACGNKVCLNCSLVVKYETQGRKRLCHNCLEDNGRVSLVEKHLQRLAEKEPVKSRKKSRKTKKPPVKKRILITPRAKWWAKDLSASTTNINSVTHDILLKGHIAESGLCWPGQLPNAASTKEAVNAIKYLRHNMPFLKAWILTLEKTLKVMEEEGL